MAVAVRAQSALFSKTLEDAEKFAKSDWPVLILGETGVGKELVAQHIHSRSTRAKENCLAINCGAIPTGLFESELFGHERGAFSGAVQSNRGLIRSAQRGSLFLDELGELDLSSQVKLLRFLDSGELRSLGGHKTEKVSARILAATNVDLMRAVSEGSFRQDLYERLSVLVIQVPPLRHRPDDILAIAAHWLTELHCPYSEEALPVLKEYSWPGNVRQLKNFLTRLAILARKPLCVYETRKYINEERQRYALIGKVAKSPWDGSLADIEKRAIVERLKINQWNRKKTAEELGIAKSTLHQKLRSWSVGGDPLDPPFLHS